MKRLLVATLIVAAWIAPAWAQTGYTDSDGVYHWGPKSSQESYDAWKQENIDMERGIRRSRQILEDAKREEREREFRQEQNRMRRDADRQERENQRREEEELRRDNDRALAPRNNRAVSLPQPSTTKSRLDLEWEKAERSRKAKTKSPRKAYKEETSPASPARITCEACKGTGRTMQAGTCPTCDGKGYIENR